MRGRSAFESGLRPMLASHRIESTGDVVEVEASGDLAYCWTNLTVRIVPRAGGNAMVRTGSAMSVLRKQPDGAWLLVRDANMLALAA
jgi:uncharacterized protein (TIGR02246 family)